MRSADGFGALGFAVGRLYVERYFPPEARGGLPSFRQVLGLLPVPASMFQLPAGINIIKRKGAV